MVISLLARSIRGFEEREDFRGHSRAREQGVSVKGRGAAHRMDDADPRHLVCVTAAKGQPEPDATFTETLRPKPLPEPGDAMPEAIRRPMPQPR
jgi:hypothetical protein